jgi:hypothetical protein
MRNSVTHIPQKSIFQYIDRIYNFYFLDHKKQFIFSICIYFISMSYLCINVFLLGRNENRVLYETLFITATLILFTPAIYCIIRHKKNLARNTIDEMAIFNTFFYRRIKTKTKIAKWNYHPVAIDRRSQKLPHSVVYMTDMSMHTNILRD